MMWLLLGLMSCDEVVYPLSDGIHCEVEGPSLWSEPEIQVDGCECDEVAPGCHSLYQTLFIESDGPVVTLEVRKANGGRPSVDITWWAVEAASPQVQCLNHEPEDAEPTIIASGTWSSSEEVLRVQVRLWDDDDFDLLAEESSKRIYFVTDGGDEANVMRWFQPFSTELVKVCTSDF